MVLSQRKGEAHRKRKSDEVVPPVSNFGYTCALGPPYRVHRACPIYRLGPSSFRRSAFFLRGAQGGQKYAYFAAVGARARPSREQRWLHLCSRPTL